MLVIVGSEHDPVASDLVAAWAPHAALLVCQDLSTPGWRYFLGDRAASKAVVGGHIVPESDIHGVVVRRLGVLASELVHFTPADRDYAAAEMNAFLFSWLSSLSCPVWNRPAGTSLCGPDWQPLQWMRAASRAGIDTESIHCRIPASRSRDVDSAASSAEPIEVNVAGARCFGAPDERYANAAKRLAALAGTPLLSVRFQPGRPAPCFHSASTLPDLADNDLALAVHDHFLGYHTDS